MISKNPYNIEYQSMLQWHILCKERHLGNGWKAEICSVTIEKIGSRKDLIDQIRLITKNPRLIT